MVCVRMVEEAVLKTVGCNRFGGSIPSHTVWYHGVMVAQRIDKGGVENYRKKY